jgi:hypothetical protein
MICLRLRITPTNKRLRVDKTNDQYQLKYVIKKGEIESSLGRPANIFCYLNGNWDHFDDGIIEFFNLEGCTSSFTWDEGLDNARAC